MAYQQGIRFKTRSQDAPVNLSGEAENAARRGIYALFVLILAGCLSVCGCASHTIARGISVTCFGLQYISSPPSLSLGYGRVSYGEAGLVPDGSSCANVILLNAVAVDKNPDISIQDAIIIGATPDIITLETQKAGYN